MIFKTMNPNKIKDLLKGHKDILTDLHKDLKNYHNTLRCINCQGECSVDINSRNPFTDGQILPNYIAKCNQCLVEFTPETKIQLTMPEDHALNIVKNYDLIK